MVAKGPVSRNVVLLAVMMAAACSRTKLPMAATDADVATQDAAWTDGAPTPNPDLERPDSGGPEHVVATPDVAPGPDAASADAYLALPEVGGPDRALPEAGGPDAALPVDTRAVDARPSLGDLVAGRTFSIQSNMPAPTPDPDCDQRSGTNAFSLTFASDMATVTVFRLAATASKPMQASLGPESAKLTYHIDDAPGGLVTLERDQDQVVAQVTLFGSGVPVVACVRAPLSPQP